MRTTGLTIALVVLAILLLAFSGPGQQMLAGVDVSSVVYGLLMVVLVGTSVVSLRQRLPASTGGAPNILQSLLIWAALFAFLVLLYRAAWFWGGFMTLIASFVPR